MCSRCICECRCIFLSFAVYLRKVYAVTLSVRVSYVDVDVVPQSITVGSVGVTCVLLNVVIVSMSVVFVSLFFAIASLYLPVLV